MLVINGFLTIVVLGVMNRLGERFWITSCSSAFWLATGC